MKYNSGTLGRLYPTWRRVNDFRFYNKLLEEAVKKLNLTPGQKVLEVACGPGYTLKLLSKAVTETGSVIASDYSDRMLEHAQKLVGDECLKNVQLEKLDAAQLAYKQEFDAAIIVLGLSVIPDWQTTLIKLKKSVKAGGNIVIIDSKLKKRNWFTNFFVKKLFDWVDAKDRDIKEFAEKHLEMIDYTEYKDGLYFIYTGRA